MMYKNKCIMFICVFLFALKEFLNNFFVSVIPLWFIQCFYMFHVCE